MMHTEGEWEAKLNSDGSWVVMSGNIVIAVFNRQDFPKWNEVNARLIVAAPKLLEACKKLVKFADEVLPQAGKLCFNIGNLNDALVLARPAITKAEPKS